jgi:hypothetical protein
MLMTPLDKSLKRAINIKGQDYVVILTPDSLKITEKGRRLGLELKWADLISGESALAVALHASLGKFQNQAEAIPRKAKVLPRPRQPAPAAPKSRRAAARKAPTRSH